MIFITLFDVDFFLRSVSRFMVMGFVSFIFHQLSCQKRKSLELFYNKKWMNLVIFLTEVLRWNRGHVVCI